jgi:DNA-binding transcriptional MerR regulator
MAQQTLPVIPDKLYFSIGETSELCELKPHVLRYWEQEFPQIKPTTRRGGRRYYQRKDVELIRYISELLYARGFTIAGAKKQLKTRDAKEEMVEAKQTVAKTQMNANKKQEITNIIHELEKLLILIKK